MNTEKVRHISISKMFKANPVEESGERFVYMEASNESLDVQGEVVLAKALEESTGYFLEYGNIDIDHITQIGAKEGIPNYELFEIGRPVDVQFDGSITFVKANIYKGDGAAAEKANNFWDSITNLNPPQRWYPSVGGAVLDKAQEVSNGQRKTLVNKVRWQNIGFSKTPVNQVVPQASTIPVGAFVKSCCPGGVDLAKALTAGYGTDSAALSGGGALRVQSLHGVVANYWDFRDRLSDDLSNGRINTLSVKEVFKYAKDKYSLTRELAESWLVRFFKDIKQRGN